MLKKHVCRAIWWLHKAEDVILAAAFFLMVTVSVAQIVLRNFFESSILWAEPALKVLLLVVAFLGALRATRDREHITVDALTIYIKQPYLTWVRKLVSLACGVICLFAAYSSYRFVLMEKDFASNVFLFIQSWHVATIIPLCLGLIGLRFILQSFIKQGERP